MPNTSPNTFVYNKTQKTHNKYKIQIPYNNRKPLGYSDFLGFVILLLGFVFNLQSYRTESWYIPQSHEYQ